LTELRTFSGGYGAVVRRSAGVDPTADIGGDTLVGGRREPALGRPDDSAPLARDGFDEALILEQRKG
jgi:hypothetical protein